MRSVRPGDAARDRGAVTAEFVIVLPAVLVVLALLVGAILLASHRVVLTAAAAEIARLDARGDTAEAAQRRGSMPDDVRETTSPGPGGLHCVTLSLSPLAGALAGVTVRASGCAVRAQSDLRASRTPAP